MTPIKHIGFLTLLLFLITGTSSRAQDSNEKRAVGDVMYKEVIAPKTRAIYDQSGNWDFRFTREKASLDDGFGTEIRARGGDEGYNHIVGSEWGPKGKYSVEYYLENGSPIFIYETFEYFAEDAYESAWRNFKGIAAWERKSYCDSSAVRYSELVGAIKEVKDCRTFATRLGRLLDLLRAE